MEAWSALDRDTTEVLRRIAVVLLLPLVAGVLLCLMKSDVGGDDLRYWLGNASAPYVVVAMLGGTVARRTWSAAAAGLLATAAILAGFSFARTVLMQHGLPLSWLALWFGLGLVSGPLGGIAGRLAARSAGWWYAIPALLLLEPAAWCVAGLLTPITHIGGASATPAALTAYGLEIALGVVALLLVRRRVRTAGR